MKIVHITTQDNGGAGLCTLRLHRALLAQGVDSTVLALRKTSQEAGVVAYQEKRGRLIFAKIGLLIGAILKFPLLRTERLRQQIQRIGVKESWTLPISDYRVEDHPLVQGADIVHLHWVGNFIDYPTFFRKVDKPLLWTLHDANLFQGIFHVMKRFYPTSPIAETINSDYFSRKVEALRHPKRLNFVSLSSTFDTFYRKTGIGRPSTIIHNSVDGTLFRRANQAFARDFFGIPLDAKIIVYLSGSLNDLRKGFKELIHAVELLERDSLTILAIGNGVIPFETTVPIIRHTSVNEPELLSLLLSAGDLFVLPSLEESFAQTPTEAMACGLPVAAFPTGVIPELINQDNGVVATDFTAEALSAALGVALATSYDREAIRRDVLARFNPDRIAKQYIEVYETMFDPTQNEITGIAEQTDPEREVAQRVIPIKNIQ